MIRRTSHRYVNILSRTSTTTLGTPLVCFDRMGLSMLGMKPTSSERTMFTSESSSGLNIAKPRSRPQPDSQSQTKTSTGSTSSSSTSSDSRSNFERARRSEGIGRTAKVEEEPEVVYVPTQITGMLKSMMTFLYSTRRLYYPLYYLVLDFSTVVPHLFPILSPYHHSLL